MQVIEYIYLDKYTGIPQMNMYATWQLHRPPQTVLRMHMTATSSPISLQCTHYDTTRAFMYSYHTPEMYSCDS